MKPTKPKQLELDFTRAHWRKYVIDRADLRGMIISEGGKERRIDAAHAKLVLYAIDSFGLECWASRESIAERAQISVRSVGRVLAALQQASLIAVGKASERGQWAHNKYVINWSELADPSRPLHQAEPVAPKQIDGKPFIGRVSSLPGENIGADAIARAAQRLLDQIDHKKRIGIASMVWQAAFALLVIEGEWLVDQIAGRMRRETIASHGGYLYRACVEACEQRGRDFHRLREQCPPCPVQESVGV